MRNNKKNISNLSLTLLSSVVIFGGYSVAGLSIDFAHANCSPTSGNVICSANTTTGFVDIAGDPITSIVVNDGVEINSSSSDAQIYIRNNPGVIIPSIHIGTGAHLYGANRYGIYVLGPITSMVNNGHITGGTSVGTGLFMDSRTVVEDSNIINNGTIDTAITGVNRGPILLTASSGSTVTFTNSATGFIDGSSANGTAYYGGSQNDIIDNAGIISGGGLGVDLFQGNNQLTNNGTIQVVNSINDGLYNTAVWGGGDQDIVINNGILRSLNSANGRYAVRLSSGNDTFEVQSNSQIWSDAAHTISGLVDGGDDTDTLQFGGTGDVSFDLGTIGVDYTNFENFEVREGTTSFSGTTSESFTVQGTASLKGTGTFGGLTFNSGSFLKPGNSIGTINTGSLILSAGSTLEIEVGNTGGDSDKIIVTGAVDVTGSNLQVKENFTAYTGKDLVYTIIENDGVDVVTGSFSNVTNDLAFMSASVAYDGDTGNDIVLRLSDGLNTFSELVGTDTKQKSVGLALDQLSTSTGSAGETLKNLLMPLTTSQAQQTFTDLAGEVHSSATHNMFDVGGNIGEQIAGRFANLGQSSINGAGYTAALQSLNSNSSNQNYFATDLAVSTSERHSEEFGVGYTDVSTAQNKIQFWGGVTGYYANTDSDGNAAGTKSSGYGVVLGGDKIIGNNTYGAAFGYGATKVQTSDNLSTLNLDSFSVALYGQRDLDNDITFNGSANYTNHQIEGERTISNINLTAQSKYVAHQVSLQGEIAKRYTIDHNKDIIPFILGRFSHISTGGYTETGAGGANLVSTGRHDNNIDLVVGARMEIELQENAKLMFGAGYSHRFGDNSPDATYSFVGGGSFTTQSLKQNSHSAYFEASFEKAFSDTTTLFAKTSGNLTTGHQSIGGNIGFRVKF